jgi:peptidoglycan/LPS O-acetylase OafA/YrhL
MARAAAGRSMLLPLTAVRFFAALAVVLFHFGGPLVGHFPSVVGNVVAAGYVSVSFFFVLSGFVLAFSYGELRLADIGRVWSFWVARLARIYPAYLLAFILSAPFAVPELLGRLRLDHNASTISAVAFIGLTVPQGWFPATFGAWNFPAWSISVELFLYLLFPFALSFIRTRPTSRVLLGAFALSLLAAFVHRLLSGPNGPPRLPLPLIHVPQFAFGAALGLAFTRERARNVERSGAPLVLAALLIIAGILMFSPRFPAAFLQDGGLAPAFGALIYGLARGGGHVATILSQRWLVVLGDASYGLYVLQAPVHDWMTRTHALNPSKSSSVLAYLLLLILVSVIVHRTIEASGRRWIIRLAGALPVPSIANSLATRRLARGTASVADVRPVSPTAASGAPPRGDVPRSTIP